MLHKADKRLDKKRSFKLVEFCLVLDLFIAQSYDNDTEGCGFVNGPPSQTPCLHRIWFVDPYCLFTVCFYATRSFLYTRTISMNELLKRTYLEAYYVLAVKSVDAMVDIFLPDNDD